MRTAYRKSRLGGNAKDGFVLHMFELDEPAKILGEVNASLEGPLVKGKAMPVALTFLQVADTGPKSQSGVRAVACTGEGSLLLDSLPNIPEPTAEPKEAGEAKGKLTINVSCGFDLKAEFGDFTISGPITTKVVSAK